MPSLAAQVAIPTFVAGLLLSVLSGLSGSLAAVFGKLAGQPGAGPTARTAGYILLLTCNGVQLALLTHALRRTSSLAATSAASAANIAATGALGRLVFGETTSRAWMAGVACLWAGALLLRPAKDADKARRWQRRQSSAGRQHSTMEAQEGSTLDQEEAKPGEAGPTRQTRRRA